MAKSLKPIHQDERYLLRWVDKHGSDPAEATLEFENRDELDRYLSDQEEEANKAFESRDKEEHELGKDERASLRAGKRATEKADALHKEVLSETDKEFFRRENENQKLFLAKQEKKKKARETLYGAVKGAVNDNATKLQEKAGKAIFQVSSWNTPGSIGLLVVLLLILAATVVPVNAAGDTRLKQFWYMLSGRASLQGRVTPTAGGVPYTDTLAVENIAGQAINSVVSSPPVQATVQAATTVLNPPSAIGQLFSDLSNLRGNFGGLP